MDPPPPVSEIEQIGPCSTSYMDTMLPYSDAYNGSYHLVPTNQERAPAVSSNNAASCSSTHINQERAPAVSGNNAAPSPLIRTKQPSASFVSSVIFSFYACTEFRKAVLVEKHEQCGKYNCFLNLLKEAFQKVQKSSNAPESIFDDLLDLNPIFTGSADPGECIEEIMSSIEGCAKKLSDLLKIKTKDEKCKEKFKDEPWEPREKWLLEVDASSPIQKAIEAYLFPERVLCNDCDRVHRQARTFSLLPRVLMIKINRFNSGIKQKIPIDSPYRIVVPFKDRCASYEACAVVFHKGVDLNRGDYYCITRNGGRWSRFRNNKIRKSSFSFHLTSNDESLLLFFQRVAGTKRKGKKEEEFCIPGADFRRLVSEVASEIGAEVRFDSTALSALQTAAESYMIEFFERAANYTFHARRVTTKPRDVQLARRM